MICAAIVGMMTIMASFPGLAQEPQASSAQKPYDPSRDHPFGWTTYHETILIDDEIPQEATVKGLWTQDKDIVLSGFYSHTAASTLDTVMHGLEFPPMEIPASSGFSQYVYISSKEPAEAIMIKFLLENGDEVGIYWEGEREVVIPGIDEKLWYKDVLPVFDTWTRLAFLSGELGIEKKKIKGISFINYKGRVYWDRTSLIVKD